MEVYIENVLLDNLIINYILIYLTSLTMRTKIKRYRILLGSVVGTTFAIILPFLQFNVIILFLIKLLIGLLIVLTFSKFNFKSIIYNYFIFLSYTFLMGGLCFAIMIMLNSNISINGMMIYNFNIPISLLILLIFIYFLIIMKFIKYRKKYINLHYDLDVYSNNKKIKLNGFLDTGNQMYDKKGNPIIIISLKSFMKLYPNIPYIKIMNNSINTNDIKNSEYLTIVTANKISKILIFKCEQLKIYEDKELKIFKNINVGVSLSNFNKKFDCILHKEFI